MSSDVLLTVFKGLRKRDKNAKIGEHFISFATKLNKIQCMSTGVRFYLSHVIKIT